MTTTTASFGRVSGDFLSGERIDLKALAPALEAMPEDARVAFCGGLQKADMERLWIATEGREVTAEDFVPAGLLLGAEVIHMGKNSLPAFSHFQKRFTQAEGQPGTVYGYNHNGRLMDLVTAGPGYFIGHHDPVESAFGLDYYAIPPATARLPAHWPALRRNEVGLQRFIYAKMVDYMRKVAEGVTIGRAWRNGKISDNYFVLARTGV